MMNEDEKRTVGIAAAVLLIASLGRAAWEARAATPLFPPSEVPAELIEATRQAVADEERMGTPLAEGETIDPNRAEWVELARLPRIGPAMAERIVEARDSGGAFLRPEDLLRISGIGPATLGQIEPFLDLSDPPEASAAQRRAAGSGQPGPERVDLNTASASELESLPGIGPALASRILEHRAMLGGLRSVDQLIDVSGIGEATVERLRGLVKPGPLAGPGSLDRAVR